MSNELPIDNGTENNADGSPVLDEKAKSVADQNAIAASHAKRVEKKLTGEIAELKNMLSAISQKLTPVEAEKPKEESSRKTADDRLAKEVAELRKQNSDFQQQVRAEKASNKLNTILSGKLAEDYADIALEKAAKNINFDSDGVPFFKIGDDEFTLEEGASKWLSLNKRFEKAPVSASRSNQSLTQNSPPIYALPPMNEEEALVREMGAAIGAGGLIPKR